MSKEVYHGVMAPEEEIPGEEVSVAVSVKVGRKEVSDVTVKRKVEPAVNDSDSGENVTPAEVNKKRKLVVQCESTPLKRKTHFIGIHLGAGKHSLKMNAAYKRLCNLACRAGLRILKKGGSSDDAVVAAMVVLENSGYVNTGKGSNLTLDKTVECDAGFMNGAGNFGGVGAVEGIPNPILVAQKIAALQDPSCHKLTCGRVAPTLLVGPGARKWAISQGIAVCDPDFLISKKALKRHAKYLDRINSALAKESDALLKRKVSDTVGVIALDHSNKVAAGVSSGGNWMKFPGRVGHSPQFGSGCWAMNRGPLSDISVAVSTTGVGEMLSKIQWAAQCGKLLQDDRFFNPVDAISCALTEHFLESDILKDSKDPKIAGMIGLTWDGHRGEFVWGHATQSLVVALGGTGFKRVKMIFSTTTPKAGVKVEAMSI